MKYLGVRLGHDPAYLTAIASTALRSRLLLALLFVDLAFIGVHLALTGFTRYAHLPEWTLWFNIEKDYAFSEFFEYAKGLAAAALLLRVGMMTSPVLAVIAFLPLYLVMDNGLRIHENLSIALTPVHRTRGELAIMVTIGLLLAAIATFAYRRANPRERSAILAVGAAVLVIGTAASAVDAVHVLMKRLDFVVGRLFGLLEDGGELIGHSLLLATAYAIWKLAPELTAPKAVDALRPA